MTQDEIMELAKQAGFEKTDGLFKTIYICTPSEIERFSKLVAESERDECAKVCEESVEYAGDTLAKAIRARGQA